MARLQTFVDPVFRIPEVEEGKNIGTLQGKGFDAGRLPSRQSQLIEKVMDYPFPR
ncbi:hypothetical protein [Magnetofaba australis]|uniref:hypothetical protein n=1 Tax=Magnetofaba australis TaxID=1472297 RepID=UPI00130202B5|nr:hypothetical protein [Magnetofaba australis]